MKYLVRFKVLATTLFASVTAFSANLPTNEDRKAVEISIGSNGVEFDVAAYGELRKKIATAVANNVIDKFTIYGYGIEGGFSGCVEVNPTLTSSKAMEILVKQLNTIKPKSGTTYSVNPIESCSVLPVQAEKSITVHVAKLDSSASCEIGSGTPLTEMQKELVGIAVYSAQKLSDGSSQSDVCGIQTGEYNVYEIAESDLSQALALGFTEWTGIEVSQAIEANRLTSLTNWCKVGGKWVTCQGPC